MACAPPNLVVTESTNFPGPAAALLAEVADLRLLDLDRDGLLREGRTADALWIRLRHRIDAAVLAGCPRLRVIATPTTGLTHIDVREAERRRIRIVSLRGRTAFLRTVYATAEYTVGLMLALLRRLPAAASHVAAGGWDRYRFRGAELHGRTVGIIGFGRVGRMVAARLRPFGVRIVAADPRRRAGQLPRYVELVPLERLLEGADIVSIHASLDAATQGLIGRAEIGRVKRGAWLINTARGELLDEPALLEALERGHLAGAALDVLGGETAEGMSTHPLVAYAREHTNLLITPHLGGCTGESMMKTELFLAERLRPLLAAYRDPRSPRDQRPAAAHPAAIDAER